MGKSIRKGKNVFLIGVFMLLPFIIFAQIKPGFKAGATYSNYLINYGNVSPDAYSYKFGFYAGGFANFTIQKNLKVQVDILFMQTGSEFETSVDAYDANGNPSYEVYFHYKINSYSISTPVVLQYHFFGAYLEVGGQYNFETIRKIKPLDDQIRQTNELTNENFYGVVFGAGYNFTDHISINGRYFLQLGQKEYEAQRSVFYFGLSYSF